MENNENIHSAIGRCFLLLIHFKLKFISSNLIEAEPFDYVANILSWYYLLQFFSIKFTLISMRLIIIINVGKMIVLSIT